MDLRQFRYFSQVARRENFRKASEDLRVAQSALTRQIQILERELGFLLFDRVKRGVRLTAAGQRLLERSQHILGEVDRLKETLQIEAHVPSGPASLAAPPSIGRLLFSRLALTFLKSYPRVQLSLMEGSTSSALGQLRRGELSLAIVTDPPLDPLVEYTHLFTESIYLVGRPDDPRLKKRGLEVKSLADLPLVMTSRHNRSRQLIESSAAREGVRLDIRLELESGDTLQQLLQSGRIYGLLALFLDRGGSPEQAAWWRADPGIGDEALSCEEPERGQLDCARNAGKDRDLGNARTGEARRHAGAVKARLLRSTTRVDCSREHAVS